MVAVARLPVMADWVAQRFGPPIVQAGTMVVQTCNVLSVVIAPEARMI